MYLDYPSKWDKKQFYVKQNIIYSKSRVNSIKYFP